MGAHGEVWGEDFVLSAPALAGVGSFFELLYRVLDIEVSENWGP